MWLEPAELPEGCQRLSLMLSTRGRLSVTDIWRRVRVLFEHGQITAAKTTLALLPKKEAPDERMLAEAARQPKRLLERLPKVLETRAAREVAVLAAVRYARSDAAGTAAALDGALGERFSQSELRYLWGLVGYEAAREHHERALEWYARAGDCAARGPPPRLEGARRAARRAVAGGARIDRSHVACAGATTRPGSTGTAARSPRRARKPAAARSSCASPARPISTACWRTRSSAISSRCRRRPTCRARQEVAAAGAEPGLRARARADPPRHPRRGRARVAVRHPLVRRPEADRRGRARAPRRRLRPRDPYRRPHLARAQLRAALPGALPRRVPRVRQVARRRRSLGARPGAPGKPLQHRRALERRRRRPDAGDAGHRALCRRAPRAAQLPAEERDRDRDQRDARHRLHAARHGAARPPGARLGRVQRRPVARAALARHALAGRRGLRRVDSRSPRRATTCAR